MPEFILDGTIKSRAPSGVDFINIEFQNINKDNFYITIENTLGQEIFRDYFLYPKSSFIHKIDVSSFSNGVYYLNINNIKS